MNLLYSCNAPGMGEGYTGKANEKPLKYITVAAISGLKANNNNNPRICMA